MRLAAAIWDENATLRSS